MPKRRRGSRHAYRVRSHVPFERLVERALAAIPSPFREHLAEVAIVIDDEPTPDQLRENDLDPDSGLYGIYEGVPRTEYGADWVAMPNRITLFRLPLEEDFPDPRRSRRGGPDHRHPRARPPPGHRRRPARASSGSTSRAGVDQSDSDPGEAGQPAERRSPRASGG